MSVGKRIKERRKQLGMSAEDLAELVGVSPATIYRYESGYIENVKSSKLTPIAKALRTNEAYLMGWDDQPSPSSDMFFPIDPRLAGAYSLLNEEGIEMLIEYADFLLSSKKYFKKSCADELVEEKA